MINSCLLKVVFIILRSTFKEEVVMSYNELGISLNGKNAEMVHTGSALNDGLWDKIQHIFSECMRVISGFLIMPDLKFGSSCSKLPSCRRLAWMFC